MRNDEILKILAFFFGYPAIYLSLVCIWNLCAGSVAARCLHNMWAIHGHAETKPDARAQRAETRYNDTAR